MRKKKAKSTKKPIKRKKVKKVRPKKVKVRKKPKRKIASRKPVKERVIRPKPVIDTTIHRTKIRVIGIGGGGGSIISEIASRVKKADFVAANTDSRALREISKQVKRFQFGQSLTRGLGTGMNVELGEAAGLNDKEKITKLLEGQDLCVIVVCLGGGTGSGATPIFAKTSKSLGSLTYGIFTLPFEFEGEKKMEIAKESLERIRPHLNAYSVIPNERIFQIIDKNTPLKNALSAINARLADNLGGLIETVYSPSLINIDFADLRTVLAGRGRLAYLNTVEIEKPYKEEVGKKLISSPLYPYTIKGARGILYNITSGRNLQLSEVSRISKTISELVNKNAKIIFGISQDQKYQDKIKITLLATGCGMKGLLRRRTPTPSKPKIKKVLSKIKKKARLSRKKPKAKPRSKTTKPKARPKPKPKAKPKKPLPEKTVKLKVRVEKEKAEPVSGLGKKEGGPAKVGRIERIKRIGRKLEPPIDRPSLAKPGKEETGTKIRRNALQVKKAVEEEEKELLEQEKVWETPAIFRRKKEDQ